MKLSEAIKKLEKDRSKVFESKNIKLHATEGRFLHFNNNIGVIQIGYIDIDREWEEVSQPLTFEEVMDKEKIFKCEYSKIEQGVYWNLSSFIKMLYIECFDSEEISHILKNAEFFIKGDTK